MNVEITHNNYPRTVQDLVNHYQNGCLNLSPGFQRLKYKSKIVKSLITHSIL